MNKKLAWLSLVPLLALPVVGLAFDVLTVPEPRVVNVNVVGLVNLIFNFVWPIVVAVVIVLFILAGFIFLTAQGEPNKVAQARLAVVWGIVGVAVIILAYSIISIVRTQLNA